MYLYDIELVISYQRRRYQVDVFSKFRDIVHNLATPHRGV